MKLLAAAALIALLAASAPALGATAAGGKVLNAEITPDAGDGSGKLVIVDKGGRTSRYGIDSATHVTKDGKPAAFEETLVGDLVVRAKYDPKTKVLTVLDLKSTTESKSSKASAAKPEAAYVAGEVAFADALKGTLSVKQGPGKTRDFIVTDATKVLRVKGDSTQEIGFENVNVGDPVEVRSTDGKTADSIRVRPAAK